MSVTSPSSKNDASASAKLTKKMSDIALKQKEKDAQDLAMRLGISYVNLLGIPIPPGPLSVIDESDARKYGVVCFEEKPGEKWVAVVDPENEEVKKFLKKLKADLNASIELYATSAASLAAAHKLYAMI